MTTKEKPSAIYTELKESFRTIKGASEFMLLETDENGEGLSYKFILRCIHVNFPRAKTTAAGLRWYASRMKRRGINIPPRKFGNKKG